MANKRKSFVLHIDSLDILDDLTNGQAGVLFKAIKAHQNDEEFDLDSIVKMVFIPFKNQFARDNEKYEKTCKARATAGSKGGKQRVANQAIASNSKQKVANQAESDSKSDSKSKSDSDIKEVISHLNLVTNAKYKYTTKTHAENISARLNDGHSVEELKMVIDSKAREWLTDKNMVQYLRPSTLFQASKFQGYLLAAKPQRSVEAPRGFAQ